MALEIKDYITIGIAIAGWIFGFFQLSKKRKWEHQDSLRKERFEASKTYMAKVDQMNESMRFDPQEGIAKLLKDFLPRVISGDASSIEAAVIDFNSQLLDYVKESLRPLSIVNQELNTLRLIASSRLVTKIDELRILSQDLSNEMQNSLNQINIKDSSSFKSLETVGKTERWKRFSSLNDEIFDLMRKELEVK